MAKRSLKIGIIGGGAAGMMCAATILEKCTEQELSAKTGAKVVPEIHIFDKNPKLGVKVAITGGGRCNVTTGINDMRVILSKYLRGGNFLKAPLAAFPPAKVREWFRVHGVPLKEEADGRVFPDSNKSADVVRVFEDICQDERVVLHLGEPVLSVARKAKKFTIVTKQEAKAAKIAGFDAIVVTTGGNAYQETGSSGDGYTLAESLGHSITKLGASLSSFTTAETWCSELAGVSLPSVRFDFVLSSGEKGSVTGPMIFTHTGISGPAVFTLAANLAWEDISADTPFSIRFIPDYNIPFETYNARMIREIGKDGAKPLGEILKDFVPRRLAEIILKLTEIKALKGGELTREERLLLARFMSGGMQLTLTGRGAGVEFVTAGGVNLAEVDRRTMQSKLVPGLYFAGEVLNVDGLTGGFNLQAAWATGRAAGQALS